MENTATGDAGSAATEAAARTARDNIAAMNQRAHAAVDRAADMANHTTDWLATSQKQVSDKTIEYVKAKPLQAIGIAFVSGLILGKLFR